MKTSEKTEHIAAAFIEICGDLENPARNRTVAVKTQRGAYEFSYATLDAILDLIRPILRKHSCALTQVVTRDQGVNILETRLMHESGEWMATEMELVLKADTQFAGCCPLPAEKTTPGPPLKVTRLRKAIPLRVL